MFSRSVTAGCQVLSDNWRAKFSVKPVLEAAGKADAGTGTGDAGTGGAVSIFNASGFEVISGFTVSLSR